jgi:hypothetical protein
MFVDLRQAITDLQGNLAGEYYNGVFHQVGQRLTGMEHAGRVTYVCARPDGLAVYTEKPCIKGDNPYSAHLMSMAYLDGQPVIGMTQCQYCHGVVGGDSFAA